MTVCLVKYTEIKGDPKRRLLEPAAEAGGAGRGYPERNGFVRASMYPSGFAVRESGHYQVYWTVTCVFLASWRLVLSTHWGSRRQVYLRAHRTCSARTTAVVCWRVEWSLPTIQRWMWVGHAGRAPLYLEQNGYYGRRPCRLSLERREIWDAIPSAREEPSWELLGWWCSAGFHMSNPWTTGCFIGTPNSSSLLAARQNLKNFHRLV